jgi:HEAT repeat protein
MPDDPLTGARGLPDVLNSRGLAGKRDYVRSLETRRDEEALSLLVECLCDESWYLRELAEAALLRMGGRCETTLAPLLEQGLWFSRSSAARVLGRLGWAPAAPALLRLAHDPVETVAQESFVACRELASRGGTARLGWELAHLPAAERTEWLARMRAVDAPLAERLERMCAEEDLKSLADPASLRDDAPQLRALMEEGIVWDLPSRSRDSKPTGPTGPAQG